MSEDYVAASQEAPKRRRRRRRVVKKLERNKRDSNVDKLAKVENDVSGSGSFLPLNFSGMYDSQESDEELNASTIDIVEEVRRTEVANRTESPGRTVTYSPVEVHGTDDDETFLCAKDWLKILKDNQSMNEIFPLASDSNETLTTEPQILIGCQEENVIQNLEEINAIVPMDNSPSKQEHSCGEPNLQNNTQSELLSQSIASVLLEQDTRSSFSSELSVLIEEVPESTFKTDIQFDLSKSGHLLENLRGLSAFFCQYFTQEKAALALKQNSSIQKCFYQAYSEPRNVDLHEKFDSDEDFLGFSDSEIEGNQEVNTNRSQSSSNENQELQEEVNDTIQFNQDQLIIPQEDAEDDIETTNHSPNAEGPVNINVDDFKTTMAIQSDTKDVISNEQPEDSKSQIVETEIFLSAEDNITLQLPGFQSASGKAIPVSQEAEQKMLALKAEFESWTDADMWKQFRSLDEYTQLEAGTSTACGELETNSDCKQDGKTKDLGTGQVDINIISMCNKNGGSSEDMLMSELTINKKRSFEEVENVTTTSVENVKKPRLSAENQIEEATGNVINKFETKADYFGSSSDKNLDDFVSTWHTQTAVPSRESLTKRNSFSANISDDEIEYLAKLENEIKSNKSRRRGKLSLSFSQNKRKYSTGSEDSRSSSKTSEVVAVPSSTKVVKYTDQIRATNVSKDATDVKATVSATILPMDSQEELQNMKTSDQIYLAKKHRSFSNLEMNESKSILNEQANRNESTPVLRRSRRIMSKLDTISCSATSLNTKVFKRFIKGSRKAKQDFGKSVATEDSFVDNAAPLSLLSDENLKLENTNEVQGPSKVLSENTNAMHRKLKKRSKRFSKGGKKTKEEMEISANLENVLPADSTLVSIKHTNGEGNNVATKTSEKHRMLISDNNNDQENLKTELNLPHEQELRIERKLMSVENLPQIENREEPNLALIKYPEVKKTICSVFSTMPTAAGFQKASGKEVNISAQALERAQAFYESTADLTNLEVGSENVNNQLKCPASNVDQKLENIRESPDIDTERGNVSISTSVQKTFSGSSLAIGFQCASGKGIKISTQALEKARVLYNSTAELENMNAVIENVHSNIELSHEKELTVVEEIESESFKCLQSMPSCSSGTISKIATNNKPTTGFQCASGKGIMISTEALQRAQDFYQSIADQHEDIELDNSHPKPPFEQEYDSKTKHESLVNKDLPTNKKDNERVPLRSSPTSDIIRKSSTFVQGFQSASGKDLQISLDALQKARALYESTADPESIEITNSDQVEIDFVFPKPYESQEKDGRKNSEYISKVEDNNLRSPDSSRCESILHDFSSSNNDTIINNINPAKSTFSAGFQCASGKTVKISTEALEKARMLYESTTETEIKELEPNLSSLLDCESKDDQQSVAIENIHEEVKSSKTVEMSYPENINVPSMRPNPEIQTSLESNHSESFAFSTKKIPYPMNQRKISSDLCHAQLRVLECNDNDNKTPLKLEKKRCDTPDLKEFFNSVETSTPRILLQKYNFSLTQEVSSSTAALLYDKSDVCSEAEGFQKICWEENEDSLMEYNVLNEKEGNEIKNDNLKSIVNEMKSNLSNDVRTGRRLQRQTQVNIIQEKKSLKDLITPGYLFVRKAQKERISWRDIVGDQKPKNWNNIILDSDMQNINFSNAAEFQFNGEKFYDCICTAKFIPDQDDACIIPSDMNLIGLIEIESSFLAMRGVCPNLVPENWVKHHYKMILLKLSLWEKWFPSHLEDQLCTPSNVLQQLKYRYDREIDRAERSILKKIFEGDESPAKRMVLLVINIYQDSTNVELELTDWWYTIRTTIDLQMANLINLGKVRIGTKLMIQGAEILNCVNGCSPLEASTAVRLKIHTNSTKKTMWDVKLGLFRISSPFTTRLNSVHENGGLISRLNLFVVRVYPLVYLSKEGDSKGVHSEKIEMRLRKQEDVLNFNNFELVYSQVQKEMEQETKKAKHRCGNVCDFSNASALHQMIEDGYDLENIEIELSPEEMERLKTHQQDVLIRKNQEVQRRVMERMSNQERGRSSTAICKIRIVDVKNVKYSAILSIWQPHNDLLSMFHEGTNIEVTNCLPTSVRNENAQLRSSKSSGYKLLEREEFPYRDLLRSVTKLKDIQNLNYSPMFNEVDLIGLVISIDNWENQKFQSVFISDAEGNMACIQFWNGIKTYGYEDVLQNNQFICAFNLQWRTNSSFSIFPTVFVTEISNFVEVPKTVLARETLEELKSKFKTVDLSDVCRKCFSTIEDFKSKVNPAHTSNRKRMPTWNDNTLNETSAGSFDITLKNSSVPSPETRIGRLQMYGTGPDISPIAYHKCNLSARKGFKPPRMVAENRDTNKVNDNDNNRDRI